MSEKISMEGRVEELGATAFQYGTHCLVSINDREDNSGYVLTSEDFSLSNVVGQNVRISGRLVEGYPLNEGEPKLLNVTEVSELEVEKGGEGRPDRGHPIGEG